MTSDTSFTAASPRLIVQFEEMEVAHAASIRVSVSDVLFSDRQISLGHEGMPPRPRKGGRAEVGVVWKGGMKVVGKRWSELRLWVACLPASSLSGSPHIHSAPHMV